MKVNIFQYFCAIIVFIKPIIKNQIINRHEDFTY